MNITVVELILDDDGLTTLLSALHSYAHTPEAGEHGRSGAQKLIRNVNRQAGIETYLDTFLPPRCAQCMQRTNIEGQHLSTGKVACPPRPSAERGGTAKK